MCGIAGFWSPPNLPEPGLTIIARRMADTLAHRGPDDVGTWVDSSCGLGLGFRRLAILDLSPTGHQPMISASGQYVIVFNGEIYNHADLRKELAARGHRFRGGSDSEVILAAFEQWGVREAIGRFNGMFAIAAWDATERVLWLARDAIGIKPLYYGWCNGTLFFASELKALRAHPSFVPDVDREALALYVRHSFVPGPYTIYNGIHKLQPGCRLRLPSPSSRPEPERYWSLRQLAERGISDQYKGSEADAIVELESILSDAVQRQMVADVPLGAFLSGGVDSSLVVALMQRHSSLPVRTFSIGFEEKGFDETPFARAVAKHLGTQHTELFVTAADALQTIPKLSDTYDEPFADSSQIPTCILSSLTRRHVTVSLSGDGGDELFGGYAQYWTQPAAWRSIRWLPDVSRRPLSLIANTVGALLNQVPSRLTERLSASLQSRAAYWVARSDFELHYLRCCYWGDNARLVLSPGRPSYWFNDPQALPPGMSFVDRLILMDGLMGLPDDMLTKVDRASSAAALEVRVPLLDTRVVELAWRLPLPWKVKSPDCGKWVLRQVLHRHVPPGLIDRPKQGFSVPIARWLRGPLRDWAEALLDERRLADEGFLNPVPVRQAWLRLLSGTQDWEMSIWIILGFQMWHQRWR